MADPVSPGLHHSLNRAKREKQRLTVVWLALLVLTGLGFALAVGDWSGPAITTAALALALIKGQLVIDWFMGLRRVAWRWRVVLYGYLLTVVGIIGAAYALAL